MECQGECKNCNECFGEVKEVIVYGAFCPSGMNFIYCQAAREEDERRGFTVEIIDEHELIIDKIKETIAFPKDSPIYRALSGLVECWYMTAKQQGKSEDEALRITLDNLGDRMLEYAAL